MWNRNLFTSLHRCCSKAHTLYAYIQCKDIKEAIAGLLYHNFYLQLCDVERGYEKHSIEHAYFPFFVSPFPTFIMYFLILWQGFPRYLNVSLALIYHTAPCRVGKRDSEDLAVILQIKVFLDPLSSSYFVFPFGGCLLEFPLYSFRITWPRKITIPCTSIYFCVSSKHDIGGF